LVGCCLFMTSGNSGARLGAYYLLDGWPITLLLIFEESGAK